MASNVPLSTSLQLGMPSEYMVSSNMSQFSVPISAPEGVGTSSSVVPVFTRTTNTLLPPLSHIFTPAGFLNDSKHL